MHHVIVTRVSVCFCLLLAGCVLGFAFLVDRPSLAGISSAPAERHGAKLFDQYCGACHEAGELTAELRAAPDDEALAAEWMAFLERHGRAGPDEDRAIVEFLASRP